MEKERERERICFAGLTLPSSMWIELHGDGGGSKSVCIFM